MCVCVCVCVCTTSPILSPGETKAVNLLSNTSLSSVDLYIEIDNKTLEP